MRKAPGRPTATDPATRRIIFAVTDDELVEINKGAKLAGLSRSAFVRNAAIVATRLNGEE